MSNRLKRLGKKFLEEGLPLRRVHADACFRNGKCRIAIVLVIGGEEFAGRWKSVTAVNSADGEDQAVNWAMVEWGFPIFTDNFGVANSWNERFPGSKVYWIPRELNRTADLLCNIPKSSGGGSPMLVEYKRKHLKPANNKEP